MNPAAMPASPAPPRSGPDESTGVAARILRADPEQLAQAGRACLARGSWLQALYLLHRSVAFRPGHDASRIDLGQARLQANDIPGARGEFERVLAHRATAGAALHGLGTCLRSRRDARAAAEAFAQAVAAEPAALAWRIDLALACLETGDRAAAQAQWPHIERDAEKHPECWLGVAHLLRELGSPAEALPWVDRLGRQNPDNVPARIERARCLRTMGQAQAAMAWLDRLELRHPGLADTSAEYGHCLTAPEQQPLQVLHWVRAIRLWTQAGNFAPAQALAADLLSAHPRSAAAWDALARLELARQHWAEAEAAWRNALVLDPMLLDAAAGLAHLLEESNRPEEAHTLARDSLARLCTGAHPSGEIELQLALAKSARVANDVDAGLHHLAAAEGLARLEGQHEFVAFERGRLLDLRGDSEAAFAAFARGNALALADWQRRHPGPNRYLGGVEDVLARVHEGLLDSWKAIADAPPDTPPAFLFGFPRSGTSLLNHVLDGHPDIQAMEEKPPAQKMLEAVRAMPAGYPDALGDFDAIDIAFLREIYFRVAAGHGVGDRNRLLLDKFPLHLNIAILLHRVFPAARFVFALRHPCDVVLSCFMQQFRLNHAMANFCTLADTVTLYVRSMELWDAVRARLPLQVHAIRYEDVLADFDGQVQALCGFLQVPWNEDLRRFAVRARGRGRIDTPSYAQVSRPLYRDAQDRWYRYREHLQPWLPALQPWIERFGYAVRA